MPPLACSNLAELSLLVRPRVSQAAWSATAILVLQMERQRLSVRTAHNGIVGGALCDQI